MPTGKIVFVLRTANNALPINNGTIRVTDQLGNQLFYELLTAVNSGISREIELPAPPRALSLNSNTRGSIPYGLYNAEIRAEGNYRIIITGIQIFESARANLPIELVPLPQGQTDPDSQEAINIVIPPHHLLAQDEQELNQALNAVAIPAVNIAQGVYIPETITVHLGVPEDNSAPNVTVGFTDYIKNVACSEIYPTWPKQSLGANILAQISLTLNRIYTEWYPSRGYAFDITSSTAFDQAYVYGRNIFEEISLEVDRLFNRYISRPDQTEPLFASYCNGTTTTCAGLSQWGTVALAEGGQSQEEILAFYYGDIVFNQATDIRSPQESYPGQPLTKGDTGERVRIIQEQLNRIAINFPQLPLTQVNGVYNDATVDAVSEFQRLFILPINGVTDRATWYRISQIYASVKRLAELTSEGQRAVYNQQLFPGKDIGVGARGSEVQEVQFYLQRIAKFNPIVQSPVLDGIFGTDTKNAVISFERAYGLTADGKINADDWKRLVEIYNGTLDNVSQPENLLTPVPFPDEALKLGSTGEYVKYIQQALNIVNDVFVTVPPLEEDGIFGGKTEAAVKAFSALFGLERNGVADKRFWDKLNQILNTVQGKCIFAANDFLQSDPYPDKTISNGSSGYAVNYIQRQINLINLAIPFVGGLDEDGRYGPLTAESVGRLQRVFGLTETKTVNESTWLLLGYIATAINKNCLQALTEKSTPAAAINLDIKEFLHTNGIAVGRGKFWGLKSRIALAKWQAENGIASTGLLNPETMDMIFKKYGKNC